MTQPTRAFDCLYYQAEHHPLDRCLGHIVNGQPTYLSTQEVIDQAMQLSQGLLELGVQRGDKIAIAAYKNRPEWTITDIACQQVGAIGVPLYPTISAREYEYILNDAGVRFAFVGGQDLVDKVKSAQAQVPTLEQVFCFEERPDAPHWRTLFRQDRADEVRAIMESIQPEDLMTIIYTSGTTGNPKGVMLTHHNVVSNLTVVEKTMPHAAGDVALSFLPLCHIFERTASFAYLYHGNTVCFTGTDNLGGEDGDLRAVKPHFFTTVPRLLEKVYEKIYGKGLELSGAKKKLFFWALGLAGDYDYDKKPSGLSAIKWSVADKLIFSKWREALGGNIKGILTGAAACPVKMARIFSAAGIPIREAYGLTETSPGLTINQFTPHGAMLGSVGPPLPNVQIRIDNQEGLYRDGEGEILAHGPNVMRGYYNQPEATAEVFTEIDGKRWFRTGDVGMLVKGTDGREFLKITDRKKELLKTSGGKYVAPQPIENKMKEDFLIEQMMVVGEKQKFVSALIIPNEDSLRAWCMKNDIAYTTRADAIQNDKVQARYQEAMDKFNKEFSHTEQVKKFVLLDTDWEPTKSDGTPAELTPTMKLKRRVIRDKYAKEIAEIYGG